MLHAKVAAGSLHARCLKFARTDRREGLLLGASAGIGQISDAPELDLTICSIRLDPNQQAVENMMKVTADRCYLAGYTRND